MFSIYVFICAAISSILDSSSTLYENPVSFQFRRGFPVMHQAFPILLPVKALDLEADKELLG